MRPSLVIFDCDGVLVDSETLCNEVLSLNLARYGLTLSTHECMDHFVGLTMEGVRIRAREMGADLPESWCAEIREEDFARLRLGVPVIPGIPALLDGLDRAGIPFCVASNGSEDKMNLTLGQTGLLPRFEGRMFSAITLGTAKPAPDLFLAAARQMGASPDVCVVIEDSPTGATAAARAGMRCIGYAPVLNGVALADLGAEVIDDMVQVAALLHL